MSVITPPRTTVSLTPSPVINSDSGSDSDHSSGNHKVTARRRLQRMVGQAVQLQQVNTQRLKDLAVDQLQTRQRRLTVMRSARRRKWGGAPQVTPHKMADLVLAVTDKPIIKFRRRARAVMRLIQVCHVCKDLLSSRVRQEPWYALIDNLMASTAPPKRKAPRPFVTFVPNDKRQLVQLKFDVADFKRERRSEEYLQEHASAELFNQ
ncbi:uncharacterized protein LOC143298643 [Babylonia areolata]|uniref:uncharacterized protein LOC143298643 n=1 Tax=Babylonia areolata TaxID=304850 RepID=UPI003FD52192